MPRTNSRYQQDLGNADGVNFLTAWDAIITGAAAAMARNGVGDISANMGAAQTTNFIFPLANVGTLRTGVRDDIQSYFNDNNTLGHTAAGVTGRPPFTAGANLVQPSAPRPKGVKILGFKIIYSITGAALTGHTIRLDKSVFANNVATAVTNLLAVGANGLATAIQANPYVTTIMLAAGVVAYSVADLQNMFLELAVTTQAGGAYRMYGVELIYEFNYN